MRKKGKNLVVLAASALSCLGASPTKPEFYWEVGPVVLGRDIPFYFEAKITRKPVFTLTIGYYWNEYSNVAYEYENEFDYRGSSEETVSETIYLPARWTELGDKFYMAIHQKGYINGNTHGQVFSFSEGLNVTVGRILTWEFPNPDSEIDTKRYRAYNTTLAPVEGEEKYRLLAYKDELSSFNPRCIQISNMTILYKNTMGSDDLTSARAYMNVYSDPFEYPYRPTIGTVNYVQIPLKLVRESRRDVDGFSAFILRLQYPHYYHRQTLKMLMSNPEDPETYFASSDFYCRAGLGHDEEPYTFSIFLEQLTSFRDSMKFDFLREFEEKPKFGNCSDAEYCVVIGREVK